MTFRHVLAEVGELLEALVKFDRAGLKEETGDVFHFLQMWLHYRFGLDGETWPVAQHSVDKFIKRRKVWNQLYVFTGLAKNISGYMGNYQKEHKVIRQLKRLGISEPKAKQAYRVIVEKK